MKEWLKFIEQGIEQGIKQGTVKIAEDMIKDGKETEKIHCR